MESSGTHSDPSVGARRDGFAFAPIGARRVSDLVVVALVRALRQGFFEAGDLMPSERDLAVSLNVSRKIVRDAIERLRAHGVVTVRRGSGGGTAVASVGRLAEVLASIRSEPTELLRSLLEVRRALETTGAALAVRHADDQAVSELRGLSDRLGELMGHPGEFAEADIRFHMRLASASDNVVCLELLGDTIDRISVIRQQMSFTYAPRLETVRSHQEIVAAIERRDLGQVLVALDGDLAALEYLLIGERVEAAGAVADGPSADVALDQRSVLRFG
jgi:GntR family transcriptional repressor for pyruvate dehydrogenase complex